MPELAAVDVRAIRRVFEQRRREPITALDGVSLLIPPGEVHGLLGPNGAGKTTLVKILSTVLLPSAGEALIWGHDVVEEARAVRPLIAIVFGGELGLYTRLSARQNLEFWGALYRIREGTARRRAALLLERVGLADRADQRVEQFSRGMKQRLHLARGLMGEPKVLFLDEPTAGMDPVAARDFRRLIAELKSEGRTILLATHDMAEAESVCDRVTLIDRGKVLATETPRTLGTLISRFHRIDVAEAPPELVRELELVAGVTSVAVLADGSTRVEVNAEEAAREVLQRVVASGVTTVKTSLPSLEEVYLRLVGERGIGV